MAAAVGTTPRDIVEMALFDSGIVGVGQTANAVDTNRAFTRLNWMLSQWNRKRWLVWHLKTYGVVSTGAQSYTVGPGTVVPTPDIVVPVRPDRLEDAFCRQLIQSTPNQIDYPLEILESRQDYNQIAMKQLQSFPSYIFYDSVWPVGVIYPWPVPQANIYQVFISLKETLSAFTSLTQAIVMPEEYIPAMQQNLSVILRSAYGLPADPVMIQLAKTSLNVLRGANTQIGRLTMPPGLTRPGIYNPYSDQIR